MEIKLVKLVSKPFEIIGYQIVYGNYINKKYRSSKTVHLFKEFLRSHRKGIGQINEIEFLEGFCGVRYFRYLKQQLEEYDTLNVWFYNEDLELLYAYSNSNAE